MSGTTSLTKVDDRSVRVILGVKLKQFRTARELSLTQLAKASGVSVSYLTEIEKAKKFPKPEKLSAIANVLGVSYDELTSLELDHRLSPLATLLNSDILDELPLELFGLNADKLLEFFMNAPNKIGAFLQTIIQLMRLYEVNVAQFFFSSLRAYQELMSNYFEELEAASTDFRQQLDDLSEDSLCQYLKEEHQLSFDSETLTNYPDLSEMRSILLRDTPPRLLLNPKLSPRQRKFVLAREAGFHFLDLSPRPDTFSYVKPTSFELILNNYKASYFAGALLMPTDSIVQDLQQLFAQPVWQEARFRALLHKYDASPEMLLHRMTSIAPKFLGLKTLFFLRFSDRKGKGHFSITKELHLSGLHSPHANLRHEHYCRRWVSLEVLQRVSPDNAPLIGIQRSKYLDSRKEYLVLSVARPLFPTQDENCSVSIGFEINEKTRNTIRFLDQVPEVLVNETCERCALADCQERAVPPSVWEQQQEKKRKGQALRELRQQVQEV